MDMLAGLRAFVAVVDAGSFVGGAAQAEMSKSVISRLVAELESDVGARLLNRTTRRISLTEIGNDFVEHARRILLDIEEAKNLANAATAEAKGRLRVLLPASLAVHQVAKHMPRFHARYPLVHVELHSTVSVETVDDSFDLTLLQTSRSLEGDFIARRLARTEYILCASPEYLDRHGRPGHPSELVNHTVLLPPVTQVFRGISMSRRNDRNEVLTLSLRPSGLSSPHADTTYAAALHGMGIAGLPSFMIEDALLESALEQVVPEWNLTSSSIWVAMPTRRFLPARTRAFLDFLIEIFGGEDKDPWLTAAACRAISSTSPPPL